MARSLALADWLWSNELLETLRRKLILTRNSWVPPSFFHESFPDWPLDPLVFGLLGLDRRGLWQHRGRTIRQEPLNHYFHQNYRVDSCGRWYIHNGPQRLYIDLAYTPWVFHLKKDSLQTHTHQVSRILKSVWLDENGVMILETEHGPGMLREDALFELLDCFCDRQGNAMCDNPLDPSLAVFGRPSKPKLYFKWRQHLLPVGWIHSKVVAYRFKFIDRPGTYKMA